MKLIPFLAGLLALACAPLAHAAPMRAAAFTDSIGVGTHLTQQPAYYDARKVQGTLAYLGVRHLRDAAPDPRSAYPKPFAGYAALGNANGTSISASSTSPVGSEVLACACIRSTSTTARMSSGQTALKNGLAGTNTLGAVTAQSGTGAALTSSFS